MTTTALTETQPQARWLPERVYGDEVSLRFPKDLTFKEWEIIGGKLGSMYGTLTWGVGDWLLKGRELDKDAYLQFAEDLGLSEETLMNRERVCEAIAPERRRPGLPFSHHDAVYTLKPNEQEAWLSVADSCKPKPTREDFRKAVSIWKKRGRKETEIPKTEEELRQLLQENEQLQNFQVTLEWKEDPGESVLGPIRELVYGAGGEVIKGRL